MPSQAKQLMDFIVKNKHHLTDVGFGEDTAWWEWKEGAQAKLDKFLKEHPDPRLKDAKNEVESLRMELRETRKVLEKAQEELREAQHRLARARTRDYDEGFGFRA